MSDVTNYPNGDRFIMSDDYKFSYAYQQLGMQDIPSVVLGQASGPRARERGGTAL